MKVLYFGTVCDLDKYNSKLKDCRHKPTVSTIVFESALLDGFKKNEVEIEIHSFPMIPVFPYSKLLKFGKTKENLSCGYECEWLYTINLPFLKQISRRVDARRVIKRWIEENKDDGIIITYSIPPFLVNDIVKYKNKYSVKVFAIIPDLLRNMYINKNEKSIITRIKKMYLKPALNVQGEYDGYIYLTDAMHEIVAPNKPYMVMEGIADVSRVERKSNEQKASPKAIMYAGRLHEKYGIINLLDAFEKIDIPDVELWLFGDGTAKAEIVKRTNTNHRIKYYGMVSHEQILESEKMATLLVNPRDPNEEFTVYSFPSKTIEYMLSGTPVLTTRLRGIPDEYFEHVFVAEDNEVESLTKVMNMALSFKEDELLEKGRAAQEFVMTHKNSKSQAKRIIDFITREGE